MFAKRQWNMKVMMALAILIVLGATSVLAAPSYSDWDPAASLESIPGSSSEVNTAFLDGCPILSRDGLQLYMASNRPGGVGNLDIWVTERTTRDGAFGAPVNMGAPINSEFNDFCPSPLRDGQGFIFVSNRPGGCGSADIYMTRYDPVDGWQEPVNLGCDVNSSADEAGPVLSFAESGPPTLYFSSTRPDGPGGGDLYMSKKTGDWSFGSAELVPGVNSDYEDMQPSVRRDGRELVFASNRPGSMGFDIWSVSRDSIADAWSAPINLGLNVNSTANETRPSISWDATMLLFGSTRPGEGVSDIYYSTRD
jgi:Tol biopolymer transport system component